MISEQLSFTETPKSQDIIAKNSTDYTITCRVTGRPKPNIYWYKDGLRLHNHGNKYTTTTTFTMEANYRYIVTSRLHMQGMAIYRYMMSQYGYL